RQERFAVAERDTGPGKPAVERAVLDGCVKRGRITAFGNDVDHAGEGVGAVEAALRAAQDFDAIDVVGQKRGEVELAGADCRDFDAVDQNQYMVAFGATNAHLSLRTERAALIDRHAGYFAQDVLQVGGAPRLNGFAAVDGDGVADLLVFHRRCRAGDHD